MARILKENHVKFLLSKDTLNEWAGLTMKERIEFFSLKYPKKKISVSRLRRLYLRHGVRRKEVKQEKLMSNFAKKNYEKDLKEIMDMMSQAKIENVPLLFLDEVAFTKRTFLTKTWSPRGIHFTVDQAEVYAGFRTSIVTVSPELGVVHISTKEQITDTDRFKPYVKELSDKMGGQPFYLFMDKLSCHKT